MKSNLFPLFLPLFVEDTNEANVYKDLPETPVPDSRLDITIICYNSTRSIKWNKPSCREFLANS